METLLHTRFGFGFSLSFFFVYVFTFYGLSLSFSPVDNHLVNCGASLDSTVDNRRFVSDTSTPHLVSSPDTFSLCSGTTLLHGLPQIYHTARVFNAPSKYAFDVNERGMHMVRFHFHPFTSSKLNLGSSQFHVLVNGLVALTNFSGGDLMDGPKIVEYLLCLHSPKLEITFIPAKRSSFAFVNAIEVISAPKDLILETAQSVNGDKVEVFEGLNQQAFQVVYRVSVGGAKVTPFNDTLWRTWVPDDEYLKSSQGSSKVYFGGRIKYQDGGASREVGPDNVYDSARLIRSKNGSVPNVNLTWEFPVIEGYKYLVRMHFCDIASISLGLLFFNVYVNGNLAYKDFDLSAATNYLLASPYYTDFVVDADHSGIVSVGVGPSSKSMAYAVDAILNGVEIMKMNNSVGSFDGELPAGLVLKCWPRRSAGILLPLIALVCLLLSLSAIIHKRHAKVDSVPWSKLPVEAPEMSPKQGKQQLSSKV